MTSSMVFPFSFSGFVDTATTERVGVSGPKAVATFGFSREMTKVWMMRSAKM